MTTLYDIEEMQKTVERQRIALEKLLKAVDEFLDFVPEDALDFRSEKALYRQLAKTYQEVSSASTMTGTSEK